MASWVLGFCPVFAKCVFDYTSSISVYISFLASTVNKFLNSFDSSWKCEGHRICLMWLVQSA